MGLLFGKSEPRIGERVLVKRSEIGDYTSIGSDSDILNSIVGAHCDIDKRNLLNNARVGDMTYTGAGTSIMWAEVGRYCCISRLVDIGGNEHDYRAASMTPTYRVMNHYAHKLTPHHDEGVLKVGNDVWIGQGVAIARKPDMTIGNGVVIGAGAVVTKSVPAYAIVAGVPAKVLKFRFDQEIIDILEEACWWDWPEQVVLEHWDLLSGQLNLESAKQILDISRSLG